MSQKLSIVIPAYNEGRTIHQILDKVRDVVLIGGIEKEVIIVNDCSKDNTVEAVENYRSQNPVLNIQFYTQPVNMGKGAALHRGIKEATGDFVIIQDADLEYDPDDIPKLLELYRQGQLDLDGMVTNTYKLGDINQGYQDMRDGKNIRGVLLYQD